MRGQSQSERDTLRGMVWDTSKVQSTFWLHQDEQGGPLFQWRISVQFYLFAVWNGLPVSLVD